ncbi:MAG: triose-phosphate isomerase [Candidatus Dormibacteraceae bacterium]
MSKPLIAANWKMNPSDFAEARSLVRGVVPAAAAHEAAVEVALFPPSLWLFPVGEELSGSDIGLGAQNCWSEPAGAFTGEVSASMLAGCCRWVLVGHSERRQLFNESDQQVAAKARAAVAEGLKAIICIGESEAEYIAGRTEQVVERSLRDSLGGLEPAVAASLAIAYEPIWAIGTGRNAEPSVVGRVMTLIRRRLGAIWENPAAAAEVRLLYGGSVKASNASFYVELADCDGCLVGGASLSAEGFSQLIANVANVGANDRSPDEVKSR